MADLSHEVEQAARTLAGIWNHAHEALGTRVSPSQLHALNIVERHEQINLNGLAAELGAIPSSASRLCDRLQAAGLLARQVNAKNRREVVLVLTRDGRELLAEVTRNRRTALATILSGVSPAGRRALLTGLAEFNDAAASADADAEQLA